MDELLAKAFDFSIRIIELAGYLEEERRQFPLTTRLVDCAEGICVCLRVSHYLPKNAHEQCVQACKLALEVECLLELIVKTGLMTKIQSGPILADCRFLKDEIKRQIS